MDMSELEIALARRRELLEDLARSRDIAGDERIERLRSLVNDTLEARRAVTAARAEDEAAAADAPTAGPLAGLFEAAFAPLPAIPKAKPRKNKAKARAKTRKES
jgi:hypothetical protein